MDIVTTSVSITRIRTLSLKWISTNFPKRLLLLFLIVLALPKDSSRGLAEGGREGRGREGEGEEGGEGREGGREG